MEIKELIEGYESELKVVTNKEQASEIARKVLSVLKEAGITIIESSNQLSVVNATLLEKEALIIVLESQVAEANEIAGDALNRFNKAKPSVLNSASISLDGQTVQINYGINYNSKSYSVQDLLNNPKVVSELLEIGSGAVKIKEEV